MVIEIREGWHMGFYGQQYRKKIKWLRKLKGMKKESCKVKLREDQPLFYSNIF